MRPDLLTRPQICRQLGISRWTWNRWLKAGYVPEPVISGPGRLPRWNRADIDAIHIQVFQSSGHRTYFTKGRKAAHDRAQQLAAMHVSGGLQ